MAPAFVALRRASEHVFWSNAVDRYSGSEITTRCDPTRAVLQLVYPNITLNGTAAAVIVTATIRIKVFIPSTIEPVLCRRCFGRSFSGRLMETGKNGMLKWLGLGLLLGTGFGSVAWAQGSAKFDGQYMGELTLTKEISGDCTQPPPGALYPLTVSRGEVRYAYVPRFDTTLSGKVDENGVFKASARVRKGFVQMTGRIQGSNLTAHIVSPSFNYTFQTKK